MKSKVLNIVAILFGVAMILFGANKFFHFIPMPPPTPEQMTFYEAFGAISWLMPLIGVGEILAGAAIAYPKTRALGAVMMFPITLGIFIHALSLDPSGMMMALPFFAINIWLIWENKDNYMHMIES